MWSDVNTLDDFSSNRITRILTTDFPQYFAVITRIRQEVQAIGPEGGIISSTVVPQVQAIFPEGALTKKIKVGLQVGNSDGIEVIEPNDGINGKKRGFFSNFGEGFRKRFSKKPKKISVANNCVHKEQLREQPVPKKIKKDKSTQTDRHKNDVKKKQKNSKKAEKQNKIRPPPNGGCLANIVMATVPNLDLFSRMI